MRTFIFFISIFYLGHPVISYSQVSGRPLAPNTILADSIKFTKDTNTIDSFDVLISPDAPDADVIYTSKDSSYLDAKEKMFYLFGDAEVKYQTYELKAARIRLDMDNDIAYAEGITDSAGKMIGIPHFTDGEQEFDAIKMKYNFRTRKGIIEEAVTKYNDVFIRGTKTKFYGGDPKDTTQHDVIFNKNAILTSCNDPHPHFGIRSSKQKFVKDKLVIIGASNLEIMGVPTPFVLPFGFFPVTDKRSAGLIIPKDYEYSQSLGFGLRNVGWYMPLGEHFDLSVQGDIYTRGSWGLQLSSNYNTRYKYSGTMALAFSNRITESNEGVTIPNKSYSIQWSHRQASQANPYRNFSASVNIQTNGFQRINFNDAGNVLNNSLSSNVNMSFTFPGKPYSFTASANHSQNTREKAVTLSLPNLNFQMQRIYPFKRKIKSGDEKWYEQISINYNAGIQSTVRTGDSTFFSAQTIGDVAKSFGVKHVVSSDLNLRVLKYFNLAPNVNFREIWNMRGITKTSSNQINTGPKLDTLNGFRAAHFFDASIGLNTALYGTMKFNKGLIRGIRHTMRPNLALAYSPSQDPYSGFYNSVDIRGRDTVITKQFYSKFEGMTYDEVSPGKSRQLGVSYNLTHIFEAKYFSKKDSLEKKMKLFDNVYMGGFYNFVADSFKWAPLTMGGTTRLLGGLSTLSINTGFSFYDKNDKGTLVDVTRFKKGKFLPRLDQLSGNLGTSFSIQDLKDLFNKWKGIEKKEEAPKEEATAEDGTPVKSQKRENPETFWQMFKGFNFNHNLSYGKFLDPETRLEKYGIITHTLSTQGSIDLTKNWAITVGNIGYDFRNKGLTYPDIGFSRLLHCWRMTFSYQPDRGTYSFNIFATGSTFNFLKLPYRKNIFDPRDDL